MHETFHENPKDTSKRYVRQLRGTPANRFSFGLCFTLTAVFTGLGYAFWENPWMKRYHEALHRYFSTTETEEIRRLMMKDFFWNSVIKNLDKKQRGELEERRNIEPSK